MGHLKHLTNVEVAEAFLPDIQGMFRWDITRGQWYYFKKFGHAWCEGNKNHFRVCLTKWLTRYQTILPPVLEGSSSSVALTIQATEKVYQGFKRSLTTAQMIREIEFLCQNQLTCQQTDFDSAPDLLAMENGVYNLVTDEFRAGKPEDMITKQIPVSYDPNAKCPRFDQFMVEIMPDPSTRLLLQEYFGVCISGDVIKHFLIMFGDRDNGKTTLTETIAEIIKPYRMTMEPRIFMQTHFSNDNNTLFYAAKMPGIRLVVVPEIQNGKMDASVMKRWCGGDEIAARQPGGRPFSFHPTMKFVFYTNLEPQQVAADEAFWSRLLKVDFPNTFKGPNCDTTLKSKLLAEKSGILNWLIAGYKRFRVEHKLTIPEAVIKSGEKYRESEDIVGQFISEHGLRVPNAETPVRTIYDSYVSWCERDRRKPIYINNFSKEMVRLGFEKGRFRQQGQDVPTIKGFIFNPAAAPISSNPDGTMNL
jgi:phage/plasmid primase, P4 family, C-terminal domain